MQKDVQNRLALTICVSTKGVEMGKIPWREELIEDVLDDGTPVKAMCWYWAKEKSRCLR